MCNRYQLTATPAAVRDAFSANPTQPRLDFGREFYPGSAVPIIRTADAGRELAGAEWGISLGKHRVTNSRDDKLNIWGRFMGSGRVVMPLSRAVEWRYPIDLLGQSHGKPAPWLLFPADESIAAIAAIQDRDGGVSMMTTRATGIAAEVHNKKPDDPRMVVFLTEPQDVQRWLDPAAGRDDVVDLLRPPPAGWLAGEPL